MALADSDFGSLLEDIDAEGSILVTHEERVIELTGATVTTTALSKSVVPSSLPSCTCRSPCKTKRYPCREAHVGCHGDRCKCSISKCSNQINTEELAEVAGSGDQEPEQFCKCATSDACNTTSCYCLAIKKKRNVLVLNVLVQS